MKEIKLEDQRSNGKGQEQELRPSLKAAMRLAQKQQQDIVSSLEDIHNKDIIRPIRYDQQKTQLQKCLDLHSSQRSKKVLKSIKAELSYLPCFQVHAQTDMPKELLAIMKRDIDMLAAVISKFVYPTLYPKGSIIQVVTNPRKTVKILLKGQISVFQPINYKSYKNCLKKMKQSKIKVEWLENIINSYNSTPQHFYLDQTQTQTKQQLSQINFNPEEIENQVQYHLRKKLKPMSQQLCKKILTYSGIITPTTPHRQTMLIRQPGGLICSERQSYVVNQGKTLEHTAICLTEAYVLQLEYNIYKTAVSLLNSDEQKKYIQTLLRKFDMFQYFDAKEYVKKEYIIDKRHEEQEQKKKQQHLNMVRQANHCEQLLITRQIEPTQKIIIENVESQQSQTKSQREKQKCDEQIDIETYQIKYDNDIYLIVSGEVTIVIDKIKQKRLSNLQHASKIRSYQSHHILKLYSTDFFGFEQIGKIKQYNLRYRVNKNSKLLLLSQNIYIKQFTQIEGFKNLFKSLQKDRNLLIASILKKIQKNIECEQLKRYQSLSSIQIKNKNLISPKNKIEQGLSSYFSQNVIRRVEYIGKKQFGIVENKLLDKLARQKEGKSSSINFKQMIRTGKQLKESLSFASIYNNHLPKNCEIVGDYIQIRNKDGVLKRRKCIIEGNNEIQKKIFRKLGIISDEDRNNHNLALISHRKSKYELEDFQRQKKQMNRLRQISHSLPKLNHFFAKKQEILYKNIHKRDT